MVSQRVWINGVLLKIAIICFIAACTTTENEEKETTIVCTNKGCEGTYFGPEFVNGSDVAHQFSNKMAAKIGDKLKDLFKNGKYAKVDLRNIEMTTAGMGTGNVEFSIKVPLVRVKERCDAYTSFDHSGGWNHEPNLKARLKELNTALITGDSFDISPLKITKEGLQEYWIQWRNKEAQGTVCD